MYPYNELGLMFGANVWLLRKEQELTKKSFALMCGISRPFLDKIEKGQSNAQLSYVKQVADALSVEPYQLIIEPFEEDKVLYLARLR